MDGTAFDWFAFAVGFCAALMLMFVIRRMSKRQGKADRPAPQPIAVPDDIKSVVLRLRAEGKNNEAAKLVCERTGCDLGTAKITVERLI